MRTWAFSLSYGTRSAAHARVAPPRGSPRGRRRRPRSRRFRRPRRPLGRRPRSPPGRPRPPRSRRSSRRARGTSTSWCRRRSTT
ncbi:hypothetical protein E4K10_21950 [Streptomyces sp. T1317-0309]|nr:hypothetical protein E4K10_21950 [Streptomyces sp. T1317-0309]